MDTYDISTTDLYLVHTVHLYCWIRKEEPLIRNPAHRLRIASLPGHESGLLANRRREREREVMQYYTHLVQLHTCQITYRCLNLQIIAFAFFLSEQHLTPMVHLHGSLHTYIWTDCTRYFCFLNIKISKLFLPHSTSFVKFYVVIKDFSNLEKERYNRLEFIHFPNNFKIVL